LPLGGDQSFDIRAVGSGSSNPRKPAQRNALFAANTVDRRHHRPDDPGPAAGVSAALYIDAHGFGKRARVE